MTEEKATTNGSVQCGSDQTIARPPSSDIQLANAGELLGDLAIRVSHQSGVAPNEPGVRHDLNANHVASADPRLIASIIEAWKQRGHMVRARTRLELHVQGICRTLCDGDKKRGLALRKQMDNRAMALCGPLLAAMAPLTKECSRADREVAKLAKQLQIAAWVAGIRGFGMVNLGALVGEAGDLSRYANPAKLWKRMGVGMVGDERQRKYIDKDKALEHGYSPRRRAVLWNIGACLLRSRSPYKAVYDDRKVYELTRGLEKAHAHSRAQRYMEKRVLLDIWRQWKCESK